MSKVSCFLLLMLPFACLAQQEKQEKQQDVVMFYNLENLFDPVRDSSINDTDFLPEGRYGWTWRKLKTKINAIAKTIIAAGNGNAPALVGVCEAENRYVLKRLTEQTPLAKTGYNIVHRDSPDPRGIDVALLYRPDRFTVLHAAWFKVCYDSGSCRTREILYAKGVLRELDTLHIFVNHWPSKLGGAEKSEPRRMRAAETLRAVTDSVFCTNPHANILVMGDFNDTPGSRPVIEGLRAVSDTVCPDCLHSLMLPLALRGEGSLKYRKKWELIDLFFVSGNLLDKSEPVYCDPAETAIFRAPFLLEADEKFLGDKVRRTYEAGRYKGGASDHLPVVLKLTEGY
ncbi:MAG: endonuclease [Prevotellaceae bacterium]|jgi:endonuclease/exonuclease/phosphatase family metal-dependent hydrolase|nr:endonuclease [Prevotellaceae bacterium]